LHQAGFFALAKTSPTRETPNAPKIVAGGKIFVNGNLSFRGGSFIADEESIRAKAKARELQCLKGFLASLGMTDRMQSTISARFLQHKVYIFFFTEVDMYMINQSDTLLVMAAALFFLGMCTLTMGMFVLVTRTMNGDLRNISAQTAKMVQKGIAEDMAGLVGNASALLDGVSTLVKTAAGVGIFLTAIGLGMMAAGYWVVLQVNWAG